LAISSKQLVENRMPENRPAIPKDIERAILVESGHRCAACCDPTPLERAHIIPWSKVKEHKVENLICLCANCHQRADTEPWDQKTLQEYKKFPCVMRKLEIERSLNDLKAEAVVLFDCDLETFLAEQERIKAAIACYEEINQASVRIKVVKANSVLAIIEMPKEATQNLVTAINNKNELLLELLSPIKVIEAKMKTISYVGTIVGESTTQEFRLAVAASAIKEQDIIAVDSEISDSEKPNEPAKQIRVWAKVQTIERLNPLFPQEAGHELAATGTNPFDTVLSLSREMVTAVCQVLGIEPIVGGKGKLDQLRYPAKPASMAYRPDSSDISRIVVGDLNDPKNQKRALDIATLANRPEVDVKVDGHAIVSRHLAILAMTGAGKSVTARRVIEQLATKNYPIVIFDPHGDYTGLAEIENLKSRVNRYYAQFPVFEQEPDTVRSIVETLASPFSNTQSELFDDFFHGAKNFISVINESSSELTNRTTWLSEYLQNRDIEKYGIKPNLFFLADFIQAVVRAGREEDTVAQNQIIEWSGRDGLRLTRGYAKNMEYMPGRFRRAAKKIFTMERIGQKVAKTSVPLPLDLKELVKYKGISIIALAGYTGDFQAMIYSMVAEKIFEARVSDELQLPVLLLLEEAHNFVPAQSFSPAEKRSIEITKQIAQEGRKFGVGLILISQRPSRLDETTLSQCNSFVIMRMVNPADQNFVRRVIESLGEEEAKNLPNLDVGEALLSGQMINFPVLVKIKEPESQGEREEKDAFAALEEANNDLISQRK
jgi:uncharacterized protein